MKTDKDLLKAFREQFNTGGMFSESNVLVLMGMARGEERKAQGTGHRAQGKPCHITGGSCIHVIECSNCNVPDLIEP
jgi:hypothetical protein